MRFRLLPSIALIAVLAMGAAPAARAQTTHLGVPANQMVKITYNGKLDSAQWSDYTNGARKEDGADSFVVPLGRTLILTDIEITIACVIAPAVAPSLQMGAYVTDLAGSTVVFLNRFNPVRQTVGLEVQRASMTAGHAIPEGYKIKVRPYPDWGSNYFIQRMDLIGYYAK